MNATQTVVSFFRAVDTRDWDTVEAILADRVTLDYTSLFDGEPEAVSNEEVVTRWRALLPGFDGTQHFLGTLVATSPGTLEANVRGYHRLGGETWMVAGWYVLTTANGEDGSHRITGITLLVTYETGDRSLVELAHQRAAAG